MRHSLVAPLLNAGIGQFWQDEYPTMLGKLGFNDKAAGFMLAAAVKDMPLYQQYPARLPILRPTVVPVSAQSAKARRGTEVLRRVLKVA